MQSSMIFLVQDMKNIKNSVCFSEGYLAKQDYPTEDVNQVREIQPKLGYMFHCDEHGSTSSQTSYGQTLAY